MAKVFSKTKADLLFSLDVYWFNRHGYFRGPKSGGIEWLSDEDVIGGIDTDCDITCDSPYLRLLYAAGNQSFDYKVGLTHTDCNYGGIRWWFLCPLIKDGEHCGKQVGKLYLGGDLFGCRHCYDLKYLSSNHSYRSPSSWSAEVLDVDVKIEKVKARMSRRYYAGKPTKNQLQLDKLYAKTFRAYSRSRLGKLQ
ncbi:MAG: hypothetical protein ACREGA_00800 [Candidatus Saccharimonadales bacterium]